MARVLVVLTLLVAVLAFAQADCPSGPRRLRRGHYTCFINHELKFILSLSNPGFQLRVPGTTCRVNGTYSVTTPTTVEYTPASCTSGCTQLSQSRCRFVTESGFKIASSCEEFEARTAQGDEYQCVWVQPLNIIKNDSGDQDRINYSDGMSRELQYEGKMEFSNAASSPLAAAPLLSIVPLLALVSMLLL